MRTPSTVAAMSRACGVVRAVVEAARTSASGCAARIATPL